MSSEHDLIAEPKHASVRVLLVEDDVPLARELTETLNDYDIEASHAVTWDEAVALIQKISPDVIVLDQRLGRLDTLTRLPALRAMTSASILMLTANQVEADRIVALELGADDFLVKPVSGREVVARIRARLRRGAPPAAAQDSTGQWRVSRHERRVYRPDGRHCGFTSTEFDLFVALYENLGQPVERTDLYRRILRRDYRPNDRSLDSLVYEIRKKLGRSSGAETIISVRNRGYCFTGFPTA